MIAVRLSRPSQPACWKASHIEPSAISESPHSTHTRYGQLVERPAGHRDADADRQALAERAGGDVGRRDARRRVALEPRAELAEGQQLLVVDRADGLQHRVVQRRRVALGEDQVVVGRVLRVRVVQPQVAVDQHGHQVGGGHRGGRVARSRPRPSERTESTRSCWPSSRRKSDRVMPPPALELGLQALDQVGEGLGELLHALASRAPARRRRTDTPADSNAVEDAARLVGVLAAACRRGSRRGRATASTSSRGIVFTVSGPTSSST